MKKKIVAVILVTSLIVSMLAGCGQSEQISEEVQTQESIQTAETTELTDEPEHTHDYIEEITAEAGCESAGLKTFTCECGDSYTEEIVALGHSYENYVFNEDATYLADGTETATCNGCELTDTRTAEGSKLEYVYTDMEATMYAQQTVNVRDLPSTDGNKLGSLSTNDEVKVTGQADTGWYRIVWGDDGVAYVSNSFLGENKIEVSQVSNGTNNSSLEQCPYTLYTWTQEISSEGCPVFVVYTPYNNMGDVLWGENPSTPWIFETDNSNGNSIFSTVVGRFASEHSYGYHTVATFTKVGDYAEGTIYKGVSGAHYTTNYARCPNFGTDLCKPGTID